MNSLLRCSWTTSAQNTRPASRPRDNRFHPIKRAGQEPDRDVFVRRCREGYEFFKSLRQRKEDLAAAKRLPANAVAA